jgi:chromosome segregation ATPase
MGFVSLSCHAQQQDDKRAKEALRRLQLQQKEFNDQKAVLEQARVKAEKDLADKDKELKRLQARLKKLEAGNKDTEADLKLAAESLQLAKAESEALGVKLALERERADKSGDELRRSREALAQTEAERKILDARTGEQREIVGRQARLIQSCEEKNMELVRIGGDLLQRYRDKGFVDALKQNEPFTQIERVRMENLWQEYRDKLDAQKLDKPVLAR